MSGTDVILIALAAFAFIPLGYAIGNAKGRAQGWCERHFEQIEKDKARRDRLGRFKSAGTT